MAYRVRIVPRAERDLAAIYQRIGASSSDAARKWYRGLKAAIRSLRVLPRRDPATPEDSTLRHLLYGRKPDVYRVIYRVLESDREVLVLHIRHGARDEFRKEDISGGR